MKGHLSQDSLVEVPAVVIWEVYRGLELGKLVNEPLRDVIGTVEVVHGDGGVETIIKVTFHPGTPGPKYMKEMFTKIDDEQRLKEAEIIEGGFKDVGFELYRNRLQIVEKDAQSSIVKSSVDCEIDDMLQELASLVTTKPLEILNESVCKHLKQKRDSSAY
ncbi:norbelladine synthase-like [Hibiscus syriacus]|uniref:norbelladine synthase-like n=1 Tax=Hibiscus syriacus TaxID=106335 RepID=UPI001924A325|nr:norbelladine synthase-like [Hibiscus syriacus]